MSRKLILLAAAVLGVIASIVAPAAPAAAAPPSNDNFAGAREITGDLPIVVTGRTTEATEEPGEPDHAGNIGGSSIWWSWTPTTSRSVQIDTCDGAWHVDTLLAVYTGTALAELTEVASNDDGCPHTLSIFSRVTLDVVAGTEYRIVVDGYDGDVAPEVTLTLTDATPPANDDRADATVVDGPLPMSVAGTTAFATRELDEPEHGGPGGGSVWYRWTPVADGPVEIDTCGAHFDSLLGVYTETPAGELEVVADNDDGCGTSGSAMSFDAVGGTSYLIAVDRYSGQGHFDLHLAVPEPPLNDDIADAEPIYPQLPFSTVGSTVAASAEPGEPLHDGQPGGRSVWYSWTPDVSATVEIATCGTFDVDTVVAVYTGTAMGDLVPVVSNDDACASRASFVQLDAVAGTQYLIAVDGWNGAQGGFTLSINDITVHPANDDFADATVLEGPLPIAVTGTTDGSSREAGEPQHGWFDAGYGSVWYRWTPEVSGPVTLDTCDGQTFVSHLLAVHTGDELASLSLVEADDGECDGFYARLTLDAVAGTTYDIVLAPGFISGGLTSQFELRIRPGAPANDNLASAQELASPLPIVVDGSTVDATREMREPDELGRVSSSGPPTIWYGWVADRTARVSVETCGSESSGETALDVLTGTGYADLVALVSSDGGCGRHSRLTFPATAGTRYLIRVRDGDPLRVSPGPVRLTLDVAAPPPTNDDFAAAEALPSRLPVAVLASSIGASAEPGEPAPGHLPAANSLWWSWTAPRSGDVLISTCGSAVDTIVGVYSGSSLATLLPVTSDDDGCAPQSLVRLAAQAGVTYRIAVDSGGDPGGLRLGLRWEQEPSNDDFADARVLLPSLPVRAQGTTTDAWIEPGEIPEPTPGGAGQSVWYSWTPATSADVVIETCGSPTATLPSVWTGTTLAALQHIASPIINCGDDGAVRFHAVAGTRYSIAVDTGTGYVDDWNQGGRFDLTIRPPETPTNDEFAAATELRGRRLPLEVQGTTVDATGPVWYRWTATTAAPVVVDTCGSELSAAVEVFTGATEPDLVSVEDEGANPNQRFTCAPRFTPVPGTTYHIAVSGAVSSLQGRFELAIRPLTPPANDDLVDAAVLRPSLPALGHVDLTDAGVEPGESTVLPSFYTEGTAWWTWTPSRSGPVVVDSCGSDSRTEVAIYTGASGAPLEALELVGWDESTCATGGRLDLDAVAGTTYRIALISSRPGAGAEVEVRPADPPANDDIGEARVLRSLGTIDGSTIDATSEQGEPRHAGADAESSVWHRWTATGSERIAIDTCGSDFPTVLAVYTGTPTALRHVASDDGGGVCGTGAMIVLDAVAGTTYWIVVDGAHAFAPGSGYQGDYVLRVSR